MTPEDYPEYCNVTPMTSSSEQPKHKTFIIYDDELDAFELAIPKEERTLDYEAVRQRPHPAPAPKFNSTELLLFAHDEWKRREERKHNHNEQDWCAGFLNGFCTSRTWARKYVDKLLTGDKK